MFIRNNDWQPTQQKKKRGGGIALEGIDVHTDSLGKAYSYPPRASLRALCYCPLQHREL